MCYVTGMMGYVSFRGATEGDVLDNFSGTFAPFFKACLVLHVVMLIPTKVWQIALIFFSRRRRGCWSGTYSTSRLDVFSAFLSVFC